MYSTPKYRIIGQKKGLRVSPPGDQDRENVTSAPATPPESMNISVLDLKWDEKKHKSIPQKEGDKSGNDQEQVTLNDFLFRNKIVEDIHDLGDLVEREQGSLILKERIDSIKSRMSRLLTNDVVDILHNGTK